MEERKTAFYREGESGRRAQLRRCRERVEQLVREHGAEAVPQLLEMLEGSSWTLRECAIEALANLGRAAVDPVLALARSGLWYSRAAAARVLGASGGPECVPVLLAMLLEDNRTVRECGSDALCEICERGGAISVARGLCAMDPIAREAAVNLMESRLEGIARKLRELMADQRRMQLAEDEDEGWEDMAASGTHGLGLVWEVVTGGKNS